MPTIATATPASSHFAPRPSAPRSATPNGFERLLTQATLRRVESKEFAFMEGDPTTHIFQIETGAVALYKVLPDGRRQVVGFAYPGDLIGLGALRVHTVNAQAIKPTRLRCLPIAMVHRVAGEDAKLGLKLYEAMANELASTRDLLLTTGHRSATERVVSFLLAMSARNERSGQDPSRFDLPMTRADIADFLGLTIETVSRTFTKLRMLGLIALPEANHVCIEQASGLRALAGENA
ncbi:MAG: helix-turn-helix domain-containing protein [Hyphomicrobiaceae bacterium]|nr:MAG: helix-turn-helix domain-containing protein [Hyphomicrobiaceae bacterium]